MDPEDGVIMESQWIVFQCTLRIMFSIFSIPSKKMMTHISNSRVQIANYVLNMTSLDWNQEYPSVLNNGPAAFLPCLLVKFVTMTRPNPLHHSTLSMRPSNLLFKILYNDFLWQLPPEEFIFESLKGQTNNEGLA